jgi:hypothetical protein
VYIGRFSRGAEYAIIVRPPENTPPTPRPAMALPRIKAMLVGATAERRDPIKKMERFRMYTLLASNSWYTFPQVGCDAVAVNK